MPTTRRVQIEQQRHKRELRQRLARSRRRIDADSRALGRAACERLLWPAQVRRHPIVALGAAAGIGVALALLPSAGRIARWLPRVGYGWITRLTSYAVLRSVVRAMRAWKRTAAKDTVAKDAVAKDAAGEESR